jgi:glycosyltransferase involved in cell wall biosynthesis
MAISGGQQPAIKGGDFKQYPFPLAPSSAAQPDLPPALSIVIPAKNEEASLDTLLPSITVAFPGAEIIIVDDGSTDGTLATCEGWGARAITHPYNMGNGAAVKSGARAAKGEVLVFMDGDGQHRPEDLRKLLSKLADGYDMVVGARDTASQAGKRRMLGNYLYSRLASIITGHKIQDLTSGFRVVKANKFNEFLYLLPNGFSYPTTITMAFLRNGYSVGYVPINASKRHGVSHIKLYRDGIRFLLIIFKIGALYSPLKIFAPTSAFFFTVGLGYYLYSFITMGRFTNMGALLFLTSVLVFLIGLISEQITTLMYARHHR